MGCNDGKAESPPKGYSCSSIRSANSRALIGAEPQGIKLNKRYILIGRKPEENVCFDVCPNNRMQEGEIALVVDEELIEQLYYHVRANQTREENLRREEHERRNPVNRDTYPYQHR